MLRDGRVAGYVVAEVHIFKLSKLWPEWRELNLYGLVGFGGKTRIKRLLKDYDVGRMR